MAYLQYETNDKKLTIVATHGGVSTVPDNFLHIATEQLVKGVGNYELDIDYEWEKNVSSDNIIQLHGHRNIFRLPVVASQNSYNLEGGVENGGHLRVVTIDKTGITVHEIKNNVFQPQNINVPVFNEDTVTVEEFLLHMKQHDYIKESKQTDDISSFNFTRKAFKRRKWDDINVKARGLFINTKTNEIVSRSYNKFFNINERRESNISTLASTLKFPVVVYEKPNGYLGTVGYDSETSELIFTSKSQISTLQHANHAKWVEEMFYKTFNPSEVENIKEYIKLNNISLVFEVILPEKDPHIIKYDEDKLVLLDIVKREMKYDKLSYNEVSEFAKTFGVKYKKKVDEFNNWIDFYRWYQKVNEDWSIEEEGYVIEDSIGFMTKLKLPYYNFWKYMRNVKDRVAKKHTHLIRTGGMTTPLHNKFFAWLKMQDKDYLKQVDIITLRESFYKESINK